MQRRLAHVSPAGTPAVCSGLGPGAHPRGLHRRAHAGRRPCRGGSGTVHVHDAGRERNAAISHPVASGHPHARAPSVVAIANPFERRHLAAGEPITHFGMFFMDVASGEVEAWSLPRADGALVTYSTSSDSRWVLAYPSAAAYAVDRQSGAAFRWGRNSPRLVALQGEHLLFRDQGRTWVVGLRQPEPALLPVKPAEGCVALSPDGETAAVLSGRTLSLVRLADLSCRTVAELALPAGALDSLYLRAGPRGAWFAVEARVAEGTGAARRTTRWIARYSWQGERLGELTLPGDSWYAPLSPDGRLIAWEEQLSSLTKAVVVADAATLAPRLRIVGATLCFYDLGSGDWLADSSGLIVRTSEGYHIVTRDGWLVALPSPGGVPLPDPDEPLPAPDRADLLAVGRRVVIDTTGKALAVATLDAGPDWDRPADLYPWGPDSTELRFALPHLGHGGSCGETEYLLPARVERPPFGPLVLAVGLPAGDCANLRAAPGIKAEVLACLPGGMRLSPAPLAERPRSEGEEPYYLSLCMAWAGNSLWLRVRTAAGQEGWLDAQAGEIGWAQ